MMIRAIIVDDEQAPREVLQNLVQNFCPDVKIVGTAKDTREAQALIEQTTPDLVFLDVEMPNKTGIQFLKELDQIDFDVIFTTAYQKYALDAIKLSALDYLVKPIGIQDLIQAVHKVKAGQHQKARLDNLLANEQSTNKKIALHQMEGVDFVEVATILYCQAQGSYSKFVLDGGKEIMVSRSLKHYEELLLQHHFYRCHKSYLVNLKAVVRYNKDGYLDLVNGHQIQISRLKKDEIIALIVKE